MKLPYSLLPTPYSPSPYPPISLSPNPLHVLHDTTPTPLLPGQNQREL
ncbi:MAG: hypothetical protein MUF49_01395 [Oculatellaceae cyanobacterium Prado106]|nr:hypothetical protein [Oculatellaceae cyanobacterium Prado106]